MLGITASLIALVAFLAFADWRSAPILCIVVALLQDPLRKLTPDQPVFFVGLVGVVFGAAYLGAWAQGVQFGPARIFAGAQKIVSTMYVLLSIIILQAINSFLQLHNLMITSIGLLTYLVPLPAIVFAYQLAIRGGEGRITGFISGYLLLATLALTTIYLEYAGYDWPIFGQVAGNLLIYDKVSGGVLVPHSGIFRASEIAAWHAMACACFGILLTTLRKFSAVTVLGAAAIVAIMVGIAVLTGRRKAVIEIAAFAASYCVLWIMLQKKAEKIGILFGVCALLGFAWLVTQFGDMSLDVDDQTLSYYSYVERTKTVFDEIPTRFVELGLAPIMWAYDSFGLFGAGIGTGTQGTQHFGGGGALAGAAEGGLGKIALELGLPGLAVMVWFGVLLLIHIWRIMRDASEWSPKLASLSYGLFSFLLANVAAFSVATQAYGDIFILLTLGWVLGFLLAIPVLLEKEVPARERCDLGRSVQPVRLGSH